MRREPNIPEDLFITHAEALVPVLQEAVRQALLEHKRAGNPIASWKDGKVIMIPPEEIPVEDPLEKKRG